MCLYCAGIFFNLTEITIVEKENISSFLIAKMYEINFHQQFLAMVSSSKGEQFVLYGKAFQIIDIVLLAEQL